MLFLLIHKTFDISPQNLHKDTLSFKHKKYKNIVKGEIFGVNSINMSFSSNRIVIFILHFCYLGMLYYIC